MNEKKFLYSMNYLLWGDVLIVTKRSLFYFTGLNNFRTANIFGKLSISPSKSCTFVFMIEKCIFCCVGT
jgi:hypothetical protein